MAQRLTKLQVNHIKAKLDAKIEAKMKAWRAKNPTPKHIEERLADLAGNNPTLTALKATLNNKLLQELDLIEVETSRWRNGKGVLRINIHFNDSPQIEAAEAAAEAHQAKLNAEADAIIDKAVFIGADEALALLKNF